MTFWQDAAPASPRFRMPRRPPPPQRRSRRRRRAAMVLVALAVGISGVSVVRADGDAATDPVARSVRDRGDRTAHVIPARWARTLPDWPALMVTVGGKEGVVLGDHHVYSVRLRDGALRWETPLADAGRSAAVDGDTVLVSRDTGFAALERSSGKVRWTMDTPESPRSVALIGPSGAQVAVVSTTEGGLVGLDSRSGQTRWSVRFSGSPTGIFAVDKASGTLATVWRTSGDGSELRLIEGATGALRWEQPVAVMASSAVVAHGLVIVGSGSSPTQSSVRAFALDDGSPRWSARVDAPFQPSLVPLVDGDDAFVVDQLGTVTRLALADGARRWVTATRALSVYAAPLRVGDAVLVTNEAGEVVTLDRDTGAIRARRRPAGLPVGMAATRRFVIVVQRLVRSDAIQAFDADRLVATARSRR